MATPSLSKLYFEALNVPSSPALWIGCSLALHVGVCLLPLGGSNRQNIAFMPGDAGVQVELVSDNTAPEWKESEATAEPMQDQTEAMPLVQIPLPEDRDAVMPELKTKPEPRKSLAVKPRHVAAAEARSNESSSGNGAHAGSAAAQPAAQIYTTQPPYPQGARDAGAEGNVRLRVRVGSDGSAQSVEIARSSGRSDFDSASISTVKREWRFRPARSVAGTPIESTVTVAIHFNLRS